LVARAAPTVSERSGIGSRIVLICLSDILPANCDLADLAGRNRIAVLVQDRNLAAGCETYRPGFSVSRWQGVTGYLVRKVRPPDLGGLFLVVDEIRMSRKMVA